MSRIRRHHGKTPDRAAFTLIELLVVVAIITLLISILLPTLSGARQQARAAKCLAQLRGFGHGLSIYVNDNRDILPAGRLPKINDCDASAEIFGGRKYRPTFAAQMSNSVGLPPFLDPQPCKGDSITDRFGEPGDRQNYDYEVYVCPTVAEWTDERNASYGYNYQFLGNSRLKDDSVLDSYKNWPVPLTRVKYPGRTVAAADCMGTAAWYPELERRPYMNNTKDHDRWGDEGFNLDPPWVDDSDIGEMAAKSKDSRSAADPRHRGKANVLWVDGHGAAHTLTELGYRPNPDGSIKLGDDTWNNTMWSLDGRNVPWTYDYGL